MKESRRVSKFALVRMPICFLFFIVSYGCATAERPATKQVPVSIPSMDRAIQAATTAAKETNWVVSRVDKENGLLHARKEVSVLGAGGIDSYELEVHIEPPAVSGKTGVTITVTPPAGAMARETPAAMIEAYWAVFEKLIL